MGCDRLVGQWAERYLGPRLYRCRQCGAEYEHDEAHRHAVHECPNRQEGGRDER